MRVSVLLLTLALAASCYGKEVSHMSSTRATINVGDTVVVTTLGYPDQAPANLVQTWHFTTDQDANIRIICSDIRLYQMTPCGDYAVTLDDGSGIEEVCGARFDVSRVSGNNWLKVKVVTGRMGGGQVRCTVGAVKHSPEDHPNHQDEPGLDVDHPELKIDREVFDSSEHGGPRGNRGTNCPCGWANKIQGRIFGGTEAHVNEFPFAAGISRHNTRHIMCGSTILTPRHSLTAAHCFFNKTGKFNLVVGEHDVLSTTESSASELINIKSYVIHSRYDPVTFYNDIALIKLEKEITFSRFVGPACLPRGHLSIDKEYIKIIGWGRTPERPNGSPVLQKVDLKVVPYELCHRIRPELIPKQVCTYSNGKSACSGDSGGPVVWVDPETNRYTLIGIVSFGTKECGNRIPRVNTLVSAYLQWIQANIKGEFETCHKV